jgi:hypothetical protein
MSRASIFVRVLFALVVIAGIAGAAAIFEAASQTKIALEASDNAAAATTPAVRGRILQAGIAGLETSWARPLVWHAGANEALSALYAQYGDSRNGDVALYDESVAAAARAVALAPVQPHAWTRLAGFAAMGRPHVPCGVEECLERSWRSAKMVDSTTACARLRLAHKANLLREPGDERIAWYLKSNATDEEVGRCLDFLAPGELFHLLLNRS